MSGEVLIVLAMVALFGGIWYFAVQMERKRSEAMLATCQAMGFAFEEKGDVDSLRALGDLPVFNHGHSKRARNVMSGRTADQEVKLLDYQYTTGSGKNSHTHSQTVALFPGAGQGLPDLSLSPENFLHKIGEVFGYQDIDFDSSPEFSAVYLLRGPDEQAIRTAFTPDIQGFFAQQPGWHVEVRGGSVGIYRSSKRCKPEEAPALLAEALGVLRAVTHS